MPSIAHLNQMYRRVNVAGHLDDTKTGVEANFERFRARVMQDGQLRGLAALRNRMVANAHFMTGALQGANRAGAPLRGVLVATMWQQRIFFYQPMLYTSLAELVFGRGQQLPPPPLPHPLMRATYQFDLASRYGVLGSLLERLPCAAAARAERSGWITSAKACLVGAIVGRSVLQVPRLLICISALVENAVLAAGIAAVLSMLELVARGVVWAVDKASPLQGRAPGRLRMALHNSAAGLHGPFDHHAAAPMAVDDVGEVVDDAGPGMNQRVTERVNAAMRRFADVDETVDGGRLVRVMADQIVADLRRFCVNAPDESALRGGVALLRTFLDITFEEAHWVAPELA